VRACSRIPSATRCAIGLIVSLALGHPLAACLAAAQGKTGIALIGTLGNDPATHPTIWKAFRDLLQELGYVEGRDIAFVSR
jgi:hypothetical protein